jgi:small subunit ribosomal protein S8
VCVAHSRNAWRVAGFKESELVGFIDMNIQDPIADMFSRIRNALAVEKQEVIMPASKKKINIAHVLRSEGYILDFQVQGEKHPVLVIHLKYHQGKSVIETLKLVSRVSLRVYRKVKALPKVMGGLGIAIISTPKGVVSDRTARSLKQGGEVLALVS